ncbi:MinD/ParA family ATP-binding protein [Halorubrum laminariae]|uniref:MinD/ParA family protein n=1 Tax=Halorubrum laminariae TaxID=1433523 RepID=A0ABD6C427_9EURY|nr:P-loop NTPase [Halorubrum laminariae]
MIAVAGGKGGSGKTTTTVGVASALSRRGASVVAADADWDLPNLTALATEAGISEPTSSPPVSTDTHPTIVDAVRESGRIHPERSRALVLAPPRSPDEADSEAVFASLAGAIPPEVPTLLDCPAGASPDVAAPLRAADRCLLVTPLRRPALRDAVKTAAIARRLDCQPIGVVAVRAGSVPEGVGDLFRCPVLGRIPEADPEPLADPAVRSAFDDLVRRLVRREFASRWRVA